MTTRKREPKPAPPDDIRTAPDSDDKPEAARPDVTDRRTAEKTSRQPRESRADPALPPDDAPPTPDTGDKLEGGPPGR